MAPTAMYALLMVLYQGMAFTFASVSHVKCILSTCLA